MPRFSSSYVGYKTSYACGHSVASYLERNVHENEKIERQNVPFQKQEKTKSKETKTHFGIPFTKRPFHYTRWHITVIHRIICGDIAAMAHEHTLPSRAALFTSFSCMVSMKFFKTA